MNEIVNKFFLAGDKFMPEMHLRQPGFSLALVDHLQKINKESKNLKEQVIHDTFIKVNYIKFVFNMTWWLMRIVKI